MLRSTCMCHTHELPRFWNRALDLGSRSAHWDQVWAPKEGHMVRQKEAPFSATLDMQQNNPSPPVDRFCSVLPTLKLVYTRKKKTAQRWRSAVNCIRHELFCYRYGASLCYKRYGLVTTMPTGQPWNCG